MQKYRIVKVNGRYTNDLSTSFEDFIIEEQIADGLWISKISRDNSGGASIHNFSNIEDAKEYVDNLRLANSVMIKTVVWEDNQSN